jgi:hypothetical protein
MRASRFLALAILVTMTGCGRSSLRNQVYTDGGASWLAGGADGAATGTGGDASVPTLDVGSAGFDGTVATGGTGGSVGGTTGTTSTGGATGTGGGSATGGTPVTGGNAGRSSIGGQAAGGSVGSGGGPRGGSGGAGGIPGDGGPTGGALPAGGRSGTGGTIGGGGAVATGGTVDGGGASGGTAGAGGVAPSGGMVGGAGALATGGTVGGGTVGGGGDVGAGGTGGGGSVAAGGAGGGSADGGALGSGGLAGSGGVPTGGNTALGGTGGIGGTCGDGVVDPGEQCDLGADNQVSAAFWVTQSGRSFAGVPLVRSGSVADFYGYSSYSAHTGFEAVGTSRIMLYLDQSTRLPSLVVVHGVDLDSTGLEQPTARVQMLFSGLPETTIVEVADDANNEFVMTSSTTATGWWRFANNSDGGVFGGLPFPGDWQITVEPFFLEGISTWTWIESDASSVDLDLTLPLTIEARSSPSQCRPDCTIPYCGDGILDGGEICDNGPSSETGCSPDCMSFE